MEKVNKISNPLNYINKVFKAEKPNAQIHLAYALSNFLIYPCQPAEPYLAFFGMLLAATGVQVILCQAEEHFYDYIRNKQRRYPESLANR